MKASTRQWLIQNSSDANALLGKMGQKLTEKRIHNLRICFKKIRAFCASQTAANSFETIMPTLAHCNELCAKMRNLQVVQQKLNTLPAWHNEHHAAKEIKRSIRQKAVAVKAILTNEKLAKKYKHELNIFSNQDVAFKAVPPANTLLAGVLKNKPVNPQQWHHWRTKLKNLQYLLLALGCYDSFPPALKLLQQSIGEWHDWQVAYKWIHKHENDFSAATFSLLKQQTDLEIQKLEKQISWAIGHC